MADSHDSALYNQFRRSVRLTAVSNQDIEDLVKRAAGGDSGAAGEISRRVERPLRAAIRQRLGPELRARVDTDDIFQSTIFAALKDLGNFTYQGDGAFMNWLSAIAERRIRMAARKHRAGKRDVRRERSLAAAAEVPGAGTTPTQGVVRGEITERIQTVLPQLPELERRVVELHSFEGRGFPDVARELGLTDKNAARHVFQRALKLMGDLLDEGAQPSA
jgi:RNA polymerase sigma-70 factor (ECF subfamily)